MLTVTDIHITVTRIKKQILELSEGRLLVGAAPHY